MARDCQGHACGILPSMMGGNMRTDHDDNDEDNCTNERHDHDEDSNNSDDSSGKGSSCGFWK